MNESPNDRALQNFNNESEAEAILRLR